VVGYFSNFELGLGQATTRFLAEALGRDDREKIASIFWTSLTIQALFGAVGGLVFAASTPLLAGHVLKIPSGLVQEARTSFYILSASIPVVVAVRSLAGALKAAQRFDLVNSVQVCAGSLSFLLPAVGVFFGMHLPGIVLLISLSRLASAIVYLLLAYKIHPELRQAARVDRSMIGPLVSFGGWVTFCNLLTPIATYLDRFLLGAMVSVGVVSYYTVSSETAWRLLIPVGAMAEVLFPAFSALSSKSPAEIARTFIGSLKYLLLIMGPMVLLALTLGGDVLRIWLGRELESKCIVAFCILAAGTLFNAISVLPANLLDALGRPDLRAKIFLSYIPFYGVWAWLLIGKYGVTGAAMAWSLKALVEATVFLAASWVIAGFNREHFLEKGFLRVAISFSVLACAALSTWLFFGDKIGPKSAVVIMVVAFTGLMWRLVPSGSDKAEFYAAFRIIKGS
jgi:O-antigen/teichoic acid export membrane protein